MSVAVEPRRVRLPGSGLLARAVAAPAALQAVAGLAALVGLSLALRSTALHAPFWIDEGLSVGIASHHFFDIPGVLRLDGSPPLYYLLLNLWTGVFGDGQATTHALSLLFALLFVPAAWFAGRTTFGTRAAWYAALLAAINPFVTYYAQETRMYALVSLLGLLMAWTGIQVLAFRRRRYVVPFGLSLVALMYAHNWGLFMAAGTAVALVPAWQASTDRRGLLRDALTSYVIAAVLYLPWVPTLLFQAKHTGAPWSQRPGVTDVFGPITSILGGPTVPLALLFAGGAGLATIAKEHPALDAAPVVHPRRVAVIVLAAMPLAGLVLAWLSSQASPAFTGRYFAVFVGPVLLLAGIGLAHAGRLGVIALLIIVALWFDPRTSQIDGKSDARLVASQVKADVLPGDLIVSVHPEQLPLLHYYLPPGLRYADSIGPVKDTGVFDWRDALKRLKAAKPTPTLASYVASLRPGQTLVLMEPIIRTARWGAPWTKLVRKRSAQWQRAADRNRLLVRLGAEPRFGHRPLPRGVRAVLYRRASVPRAVTPTPPRPNAALGSVSGG